MHFDGFLIKKEGDFISPSEYDCLYKLTLFVSKNIAWQAAAVFSLHYLNYS